MNGKITAGALGILACSATAARANHPSEAAEPRRPNIIVIYTDDMGIGDLSCYGGTITPTPNIDRLASEGLRMTGYYSAAPVSSPSRVGITTGIFPLQCGMNTFLNHRAHNTQWEQFDYLDPAMPSVARELAGVGYRTAHFGKWHMGGGRDVDNAPSIARYGFEEFASTWESPEPHPALTGSDWIWSATDQVKRWERTAWFVDRTLDFLERHSGEPCYINLWPDDVHDPWVPDEESQSDRKSWQSQPSLAAVLAEYDRQIGRLMEGLRRLGLSDNTMIVFTSDNGPAPSFEQIRTNGLRGLKVSLYEGGIRMPMIVRWPARVAAGRVDDTSIVGAVDILPSLCAIAGAPLPKDVVLSGEDMSRALTGTPQVRRRDLMWEYGRSQLYGGPREAYHKSPHLAIRRGDWKLLTNSTGDRVELYNLATDENETTDVSDANPKIVRQLHKAVLKWWATRKTPQAPAAL
jgi:arylsulfatase A-like enzyme